jgi:hypothetical protein
VQEQPSTVSPMSRIRSLAFATALATGIAAAAMLPFAATIRLA